LGNDTASIFSPAPVTVNAKTWRTLCQTAKSTARPHARALYGRRLFATVLTVSLREILELRVRAGLNEAAAGWFAKASGAAATGDRTALLRAYTEASRYLGRLPLPAGEATSSAPETRFNHWALEDAGRLVLLLKRHRAESSESFAADAIACYEMGDTREQQSWLRAVAFLPDAHRYLALVIDACRTNILPLFEAVACENPYPGRYFPEPNFNQMVLKALFNNVALARIEALSERVNPDLARMAADYAAERRAAGRSIPADIGLAMAGLPERAHS
jgi:hypothetical protein